MDKLFIQNDFLKVGIKKKGAELSNIIGKDGQEYMWQAHPTFWGRHSCILFPHIGKVTNDQFTIDGQKYSSTQHGFARNTDFEILEQREEEIVFQLKYDAVSLKKYPYQFNLIAKYQLVQNQLNIIYRVENLDTKTIYFSLGAHPAFNVPLHSDKKRADYVLSFDKVETAESLNLQNGFRDGTSRPVIDNGNTIPILENTFDHDALIFKDLHSDHISLIDNEGRKIWTFGFEGFSYLGIWSKNSEAPFVCIEPWMGVADPLDADWEFKDKEGVLALSEAQHFECCHTFKVHHD